MNLPNPIQPITLVNQRQANMSLLGIILIVLVIVLLFGGYGYNAGYHTNYAYFGPGIGVVGLVLVILLVLVLFGRL